MTTRLAALHVAVRGIRNIEALDLDASPRLNVVSGDNGQGKTTLLEAVYLAATSRSFRAERPLEMLRQGADLGTVRLTVVEEGIVREHRVTLTRRERSVQLDGKAPESLAGYATKTPVVVFHPGDLVLLSGPASGRRKLLDRIALFVDPVSADHRARYQRASRARAVALEERGPRAADLPPLEHLMAVHGSALARSRALAAERLGEALSPVFAAMAAPGLELSVQFAPGGSLDAAELGGELEKRREVDLRRKAAGYGPHKDDLEVSLDGRGVRRHASQGQSRILTLALKVAELECIRQARGAEPILLLDDVSSELDPDRTGAVYAYLHTTPSQIWVTTTRPELFTTPGIEPASRADFRLVGGRLASP